MITNKPLLNDYRLGFGIHDNVIVKVVPSMEGWTLHQAEVTWGIYRGWGEGFHYIVLRETPSAIDMSRTLFHELAHVRQAEAQGSFGRFAAEFLRQCEEARCTTAWERMVTRTEWLRRYHSIPYEAEAIEISNALVAHHELPLPFSHKHPPWLID